VKPLQPSITVSKVSIEETKPLYASCRTTGSRPRATLQWRLGQKDVTSNATEWFNHDKDSDTYRVKSDLAYTVGKSDLGQVLTCKAVNAAAPSGLQTSITLNVKCKLNKVRFSQTRISLTKMVMSHDSFVIVLNHIIMFQVIWNYIIFIIVSHKTGSF